MWDGYRSADLADGCVSGNTAVGSQKKKKEIA